MNQDIQLSSIAKKIKRLPTLPGVAVKILEVFQKESFSVKELSDLISTDPPLALKVLKAVNSPFYGLKNRIESLGQAITFLGLNSVKNLALSFSLIRAFSNRKTSVFNYSQFWKDSLVGAVSAKLLAERIDTRHSESAFLIGLLQNIGSLILVENFPQAYEATIRSNAARRLPLIEIETQAFGLDHMTVGRHLLKAWGLPDTFSIPIGFHHTPDELKERRGDISSPVNILHLSSLVIELFTKKTAKANYLSLDRALLKYGLEKTLDRGKLAEEVSEAIKTIFPIFDLEVDTDQCLQIIESAKSEVNELAENLVIEVDHQKESIENLKQQVAVDGLTQLNNQKRFYEILQQEVSRAIRYKIPLALIMADIDLFKSVNDFYGHLSGDHVLKSVSAQLKAALRDSDHIARYGGEEFAIILPLTDLNGALLVAERLRHSICELRIPCNDKMVSVTMSFGVASLEGSHKLSVEGFIRLADEALYEAKNAGRNCCIAYRKKDPRETLPKILVIDDEEIVLVTVSKMLERLGFDSITATDGQSAIEQCNGNGESIRMVLIDVMMPGMSPRETISKIKSLSPESKIILSSGFEASQIQKDVIDCSDGYLGKPYSMSELQGVFDTFFPLEATSKQDAKTPIDPPVVGDIETNCG
jgi:diguanylate cyclase (GGDEF)-like protein